MIIAERVNDFITKRHPMAICDACIAQSLGLLHQQANRVTMALGTTSDFDRGNGICVDCGKEQKVTARLTTVRGGSGNLNSGMSGSPA